MPQCSRRGMLQPAPHSLSIVKRKRGHLCALACSELLACFQEVDSLVGTLFHEIPGGGLLKGKRCSSRFRFRFTVERTSLLGRPLVQNSAGCGHHGVGPPKPPCVRAYSRPARPDAARFPGQAGG